MTRQAPARREDYRWFDQLSTRWMDNDIYGHVNNVTYYSYFDTTVNRYLIEAGGLDIHHDPVVGFVVSSNCRYHAPIAFPEALDIGLRVEHLGERSARYELAIFRTDSDTAVADGEFVHVFVERTTGRATAVPTKIAHALAAIQTMV